MSGYISTIAHPIQHLQNQFQSPGQQQSSSIYPHLLALPTHPIRSIQHAVQPWLPHPGPSYSQPQQYSQQQQPQYQQQQPQQPGHMQQYDGPSIPSWQRPSPSYTPMSTALQPQQFQSVSKDEDPVYGPLERARGQVERGLTADNEISPDLADLLPVPCQLYLHARVRR
jgi:hypothetical protein